MSVFGGIVLIFFWFFFMWLFRYVNLVLLMVIINKAKKQVEENVKEKLKGLKGDSVE